MLSKFIQLVPPLIFLNNYAFSHCSVIQHGGINIYNVALFDKLPKFPKSLLLLTIIYSDGIVKIDSNLIIYFSPMMKEFINSRTKECKQCSINIILPDVRTGTVLNLTKLFSTGVVTVQGKQEKMTVPLHLFEIHLSSSHLFEIHLSSSHL